MNHSGMQIPMIEDTCIASGSYRIDSTGDAPWNAGATGWINFDIVHR